MPDFKLSHKTKLTILAVVVFIIAIAAAIAVPTIISRDAARSELIAAMPSLAPFEVNADQTVTISGTGNGYLLIVAPDNVTQADAVALFKAYCEKRATVQNADVNDEKIYRQVTMKLVMPDGGWRIERPDSLAELDSGSAVKSLKP